MVNLGEVSVYDATIINILLSENKIYYCCDDGDLTEVLEEDVIAIDDTAKLTAKIVELMQEIHKREENNNG